MNKLANERKPMEEKACTQSETGSENAIADKRTKVKKRRLKKIDSLYIQERNNSAKQTW